MVVESFHRRKSSKKLKEFCGKQTSRKWEERKTEWNEWKSKEN